MNSTSVVMRVTSVRKRGGKGGAIFFGYTDTDAPIVARCDYKVIPDSSIVDRGQQWAISGKLEKYNNEVQIRADSASLLRPSGRNIIAWIADSEECVGIGTVKARKLYEKFGPDLLQHIEARKVALLSTVIGEKAAEYLCEAFEKYKVADTLLWLDRLVIPRKIGQKVVHFYKDDARQKIEENPYRLISFSQEWNSVDQLARFKFNIASDDPRRLEAAVEQVLYTAMDDGHTCLPVAKVHNILSTRFLNSKELANRALASRSENSQYVLNNDYLQPSGMYLIENYVAERLRDIAKGEEPGQLSFVSASKVNCAVIDSSIKKYEEENGFSLTDEQRQAVFVSVTSNFSLILGGAGTGKTTVLKSVYKALQAAIPGIAIYQVALAGLASQMMQQATGTDSLTIAGFLNKIDASQLGHGTVVVIDEMSMVDILLFYRFLRHIPPGTKLILVGDPSQLPPIGPGLVLHALAGHPSIKQTILKTTQRQTIKSGIPAVAEAVRQHKIPEFANYKGKGTGVSFVSCSDDEIEGTVQRIYADLDGKGLDYRVQILSITKMRKGGVNNLNKALHDMYREHAEQIYSYDSPWGIVSAATTEKVALKVGDLVMYTENNYKIGLRNGSLGIITKAISVTGPDSDCCLCVFNGIEHRLSTEHLKNLKHAYAITVHKSQGSQSERVIVALRSSPLLDQTLIYTAITRGVEQVVLVGNREATLAAIQAPPSVAFRHTTLGKLISMLFSDLPIE